MKKATILALVLIFFLCLNFAASSENTQPIEIRSVEDLALIEGNTSGHYILMNDLDLNGSDWKPIGEFSNGINTFFEGTFDGNGKAISNFTIFGSYGNYDNIGFFKFIEKNGTVKNLVLKDVQIKGGQFAGCVAGYNKGTIENCHVINATIENEGYAGGITGSSQTVISNCSFNGSIKSITAGGIVGTNIGDLKSCFTNSNIEGMESKNMISGSAGGIAGANFGVIENSYSVGTIKGEDFTGGIAGGNYVGSVPGGGVIIYSYAANTITGTNDAVGGITGVNKGFINNCVAANDKIEGKRKIQFISPLRIEIGGGGSVGRIAGDADYDKIPENCYSSNEMKTNKLWFNGINGQKMPLAEITETFPENIWTEWNTNIWKTNPDAENSTTSQMPILTWQI